MPTSSKIEQLLATPDAFQQWLNTFEDNQIVGFPRSCGHCPISNFLKTKEVHSEVQFIQTARTYVVVREHNTCKEVSQTILPGWVEKFARFVDNTEGGSYVHASEARKYLDRVLKSKQWRAES